MSPFMQPISFARSFLSKGLSKSVRKPSAASTVLQPAVLVGMLGCAISVNVQAAVGVEASVDSTNPTDGLQLISLNTDEIVDENDANNLSNIADMLDVADEPDDSIDSVPDESALIDDTDDTDDIDTDIPAEVAQVSLNAISPETLKTFVAVVDLVRREYVDTVNDEELFSNAMSGMLTKLDSHAEFLDAEEYENLRAFTEGDVGDIGLKVNYQPEAGYWVVTEVIDDSPADKKGIAT